MARRYSASSLRADLYRVLDSVLETGVPVEVERKGRRVWIVAAEGEERLGNLKGDPEYLKTDPEDLVHIDWSTEWQP
jgi:hypothetical protein